MVRNFNDNGSAPINSQEPYCQLHATNWTCNHPLMTPTVLAAAATASHHLFQYERLNNKIKNKANI
jgi:hypothetical protein